MGSDARTSFAVDNFNASSEDAGHLCYEKRKVRALAKPVGNEPGQVYLAAHHFAPA